MRKKAAIADLPSGVGVTKALNGAGVPFWRVRLGKRFTGSNVPIVEYFSTLSEAKDWLEGDEPKKHKTRSPKMLETVKSNFGEFSKEELFWSAARLSQAESLIRRVEAAGLTLNEAVDFAIAHLRPSSKPLTWDDAIALGEKEQRETATNMGHRDSRMLYAHYQRSLKSKPEVDRFWAMAPEVVEAAAVDASVPPR